MIGRVSSFSPMNLTSIKYSLLLVCFVLSACKSVRENLSQQYDRASVLYEEAYLELKNKEPREIGWREARAMMLENNLELQRARDSLERAKESRSQIYWDLVPSIRLSTALSKALTDLGTVDSRDLRFSVFSTINLPGIVSLYSRRYSALLAELKSEWDLQLKERELIIRLRELFLEYSDFEIRKGNISQSQLWNPPGSKTPAELLNSTPEEILLEQQAFNLRLSENRLSQSMAKILGNFDYRWKLTGGELPKFSYAENPLDLNKTARLGVLLRRKQAADLEALRLTELATKLRYFPDLNLGVSSPSLYRIGNGRERGFSADDLIVHANSVVSLDTSFRLTRQLKNVRRQIELQDRIMKVQIREQIQRAILAQEELLLVERELALAELRIETLDAQPRSTELDEVRVYLEKRFVLIERASSLRLKKARIEGGFWLLDEDKWKDEEKSDEE
jgi:hypothetical protein